MKKLYTAEVLTLLNLVFYSLLRFSINFSGFNWYGLYVVFSRLYVGVFFAFFFWWIHISLKSSRKIISLKTLKNAIPKRECLIVFLLFFSYWSLAGVSGGDKLDLIHLVTKQDRDDLLIKWDIALLGFHPSQELEKITHPRLTELMLLVYIIAYLPLFIMLLFIFHDLGDLKGKKILVTSFVIAYTVGIPFFFLVPAVGPLHTLEFNDVMCGISSNLGGALEEMIREVDATQRNSFPSLHIALSTIVLILSKRLKKREHAYIALLIVLMWFSTLYLRYHYFIDLIAGWILAILSVKAARKFAEKHITLKN